MLFHEHIDPMTGTGSYKYVVAELLMLFLNYSHSSALTIEV